MNSAAHLKAILPFRPDRSTAKAKKKPAIKAGNNTGSNVSNVVLFFGRATVEVHVNNNHSYYHL